MDFNHYFTNDELEQILKDWANKFPKLVALEKIGESYQKRPIWLLVLTNKETGPDTEKPAVWLDANIHATEISGTTTTLKIVDTLLNGFGGEAQATRLLNNAVYYVVPRVNPDGAALAMADKPRYVRSGVRSYPWPDIDEGLHEEDIDGDGRILQMRYPDPNGDWKISSLDPRMMEKRLPHDQGGVYYRLLTEGKIENYDGYTFKIAAQPEGLDFNRNFPFAWRTEDEQEGAGPYPASEPETHALIDFITKHPNISLSVSYHTFSRVILRPYSTKSDEEMETGDLWVFKKIGKIGTELTGYRCVSTFHDFKYHPKQITTGGFDDWFFDHQGAFSFTIELWDLPTEAGIKDRSFIDWFREHPHEDDLLLLKWADDHGGEGAFVNWYEFDHPQLGKVELGGWNHMYTWSNPPIGLIGAEAERNLSFALALGDLLPSLSVHALNLTRIEQDTYRLEAVVENSGFLPTCTSEIGKKRKVVRPVRVELELPEGVEILSGRKKTKLGHLEGRSNKLDADFGSVNTPTDHRARAEWALHGKKGQALKIHVLSERAGSIHLTQTLP